MKKIIVSAISFFLCFSLFAQSKLERGKEAFNRGQNNTAYLLLNEYVKENPQDGTALFMLGLSAFNIQKYEEAIAAYRQVIAVQPKNFEAIYNLANAYYANNDVKQAQTYYLQALAIKSDDAAVLYNLGNTYLDQQDYPAARKYLKTALTFNRNDSDAITLLGIICEAQGVADSAAYYYRTALYKNPAANTAKYNLANLLLDTKDYLEAEKYFRELTVAEPTNGAYFYGLASALQNSGQNGAALENLKKAATLGDIDAQKILTKNGYKW